MSLIQVVSLRAGIQSDGALAGHPAVIVETGPVSETMSPAELLSHAEMLAGGPCLISIIGVSGSDPAIQPLDELIELGQEDGFRFAVEIHGSEAPEWLESLDYLTVAVPAPSDGVATDYKALHQVMGAGLGGKPKLSILVAIADDADFAFAEMLHELFPPIDFYVTPGILDENDTDNDIFDYLEHARWIAETVIERQQPDMRLTLDLAALAGVKAGVSDLLTSAGLWADAVLRTVFGAFITPGETILDHRDYGDETDFDVVCVQDCEAVQAGLVNQKPRKVEPVMAVPRSDRVTKVLEWGVAVGDFEAMADGSIKPVVPQHGEINHTWVRVLMGELLIATGRNPEDPAMAQVPAQMADLLKTWTKS